MKRSTPSDCGSVPAPIGNTRFEAKRLWQNPFSHGYRAIRHNKGLTPRVSHAFGVKAWRISRCVFLGLAVASLFDIAAAGLLRAARFTRMAVRDLRRCSALASRASNFVCLPPILHKRKVSWRHSMARATPHEPLCCCNVGATSSDLHSAHQ